MAGMVEQREKIPKDVEELKQALGAGQALHNAYVILLGLREYETRALHRRVERGLSYGAVERLQRNILLSLHAMAALLSIPPRTLARRKERGRLDPAESDRLLRLSRVVAKAIALFDGDFHAARSWLFASQRALGGVPPIEFAKTEVGAHEVEGLIGRLEHGIPS